MEQESVTDVFSKKLHFAMKRMMQDGLWPYSPLWSVAKLNAILEIAKELKTTVNIAPDFDRAVALRRIPFFKNYGFVIFLNNLLQLKQYFKRYYVMDGHKFWVKPARKMMEIINDYKCLNIWEPETTKLVKEYVREGMTCVDVGASVGYFTLLFARQVGSTGKVIAIEPTDFQQPYLKRNIEVNGYRDRVVQYMLGAWDRDEVISQPRNAAEYVQTKLRCRPMDDVLSEVGISRVDFIKIDTDGAEPWVLRGLVKTIEQSPNLKMIIEYYPKYIEYAGGRPQEVLDFLNKYFTWVVVPGDYSDGCWNYFCTRK